MMKGIEFMKFNPTQIRDILIAVSESLTPNEYGYVSPISPIELLENNLTEYPQNETFYWIRQLMDAGILVKGSQYINEPLPQIKNLSISGYQFIENTSKPEIWKEIRTQLLGVAISNIPDFFQKVISLSGALLSK